MRSLMSLLERGGAADAVPDGRPEMLRRETIATNASIILAASAIATLPALYLVANGRLLPFILTILGLATGSITLALHRRGQFEGAASGQVYCILAAGLMLTAADPTLVDFGLAIALMAPVYAALMTRTAMKKLTWVLLTGVVAFATLGAYGAPLWPEPFQARYGVAAGIGFAVIALIVALSANRLNSVFEVYEKSQITAFRHLIEHVQDAVLRFSAEGKVLFVSQSSESLFGCRRYDLDGSGLIDRIHVLDRPRYMTAFADANRGAKSRTVEMRMRRDQEGDRTPSFFWVEVSLSPVIDPETPAERHEVLALFRDVTERKDHETTMRKARKLAEDASEAKSRFLATIGHELRTPLNAIVGFSEMMTTGVAGEISPQQREYAELIHKSGLHLIDVVRMLLDMSKIEAGKFELQTDSLEPRGLIEPCLKMVDAVARQREIHVTTHLPRMLPNLIADERACRQILINLLSNAIKFSHQGGTVSVSMKRQGRFLNLSVADKGIGMTREALERIGEPFFQAEDGLSRGYEGTGLGLSIVKGLVDLHQGELHVTSTPGEGTTITVLLPLNGPVVKSVETGAVTKLRTEPNGTSEEEKAHDGNHSVASAAAGR